MGRSLSQETASQRKVPAWGFPVGRVFHQAKGCKAQQQRNHPNLIASSETCPNYAQMHWQVFERARAQLARAMTAFSATTSRACSTACHVHLFTLQSSGSRLSLGISRLDFGYARATLLTPLRLPSHARAEQSVSPFRQHEGLRARHSIDWRAAQKTSGCRALRAMDRMRHEQCGGKRLV